MKIEGRIDLFFEGNLLAPGVLGIDGAACTLGIDGVAARALSIDIYHRYSVITPRV